MAYDYCVNFGTVSNLYEPTFPPVETTTFHPWKFTSNTMRKNVITYNLDIFFRNNFSKTTATKYKLFSYY